MVALASLSSLPVLAQVDALGLPSSDGPINVAQTVGFGVIAALMVFAALKVVTTRNVVHAAVWLVVVLAGSAAQFVLLAAEFVAVTQVMVYIGAVIVLFLFGVMLTRGSLGVSAEMTRRTWYAGAFVAVVLLGLLSWSIVDTFEDARLPEDRRTALVAPAAVDAAVEAGEDAHHQAGSNTAAISDAIFGGFMIPFQAVGVLLTAALVGAIVIARRD